MHIVFKIFSVFMLAAWMQLTADAQERSQFKADDGTYSIIDVTSQSECTALCKADKVCRGAVTYQADITKPEMQCRLNNGFGENAVFPSTPPEPLIHDIAVADLNTYRISKGLNPVRLNDKLSKASKVHAEDLAQAGIISHTGTDGSGHGDRAQRQGYYFSIAGENVATGQKSWDKVFQAWKDSPGHNENLLRDDVVDFGIALVYEPKTTYMTYWAMIVASPLEDPNRGVGTD
jgi:uncharacterized protein YkwD